MSGSWGVQLCGLGTGGQGNGTYGPFDCPGGRLILTVAGTFGAATAQLTMLGPDGATAINVGTGVTAAGQQLVEIAPCQVSLVISGGTGTALYATLSRVVQ